MPARRRKRQRLGDSTVPAERLRAERPNHVWALDFQHDQTADGRVLRLLNVVDEFTREALEMLVERSIGRRPHGERAGAARCRAGSPWQNPFVESFHSRVRDELLDVEEFSCLAEAKVVLGDWREDYNQRRPHSALGMRTPAAFAAAWATASELPAAA